MKPDNSVKGSLPAILRNDVGGKEVYEGNLVYYFQVIFKNAKNLQLPYHNFRHLFHVTYLCYQACVYYAGILTPKEMRELMIAAMFHDFNHSGKMGNDYANIAEALRGLEEHIAPEDRPSLAAISNIIRATEYPYVIPTSEIELRGQIIRDADLSQGFSVAWIQQVVFGLAKEWNKEPIEVLRAQIGFLGNLEYYTDWAKDTITRSDLNGKMNEVRELLDLLEFTPAQGKVAVPA